MGHVTALRVGRISTVYEMRTGSATAIPAGAQTFHVGAASRSISSREENRKMPIKFLGPAFQTRMNQFAFHFGDSFPQSSGRSPEISKFLLAAG